MNQPLHDRELLKAFAANRSEKAFKTLVERHVKLVYGVALRHVRQPALAEDITQAVFIVLSQKAASLVAVGTLGGWLVKVTRCAAIDALRHEDTRTRHELCAAADRQPAQASSESQRDVLVAIDQALARLASADREALVLRFYENASYPEMGVALGISEEAARKRTTRALSRLKQLLMHQKGMRAAAVVAGLVTLHQSAVAVPAGLAMSIAGQAVGSAGMKGSSVLLAKGVTKMFTAQAMKLAAAVTTTMATAAVIGGGTAWVKNRVSHDPLPMAAAMHEPTVHPAAQAEEVTPMDVYSQPPAAPGGFAAIPRAGGAANAVTPAAIPGRVRVFSSAADGEVTDVIWVEGEQVPEALGFEVVEGDVTVWNAEVAPVLLPLEMMDEQAVIYVDHELLGDGAEPMERGTVMFYAGNALVEPAEPLDVMFTLPLPEGMEVVPFTAPLGNAGQIIQLRSLPEGMEVMRIRVDTGEEAEDTPEEQ